MDEPFLPRGVDRPDFYIAAMGRSGSTMLCNWLSNPPHQLVFVEPSFLNLPNTRLLRIQLENLGLGASEQEWNIEEVSSAARFARLMAPRLKGRRWAVKEVLCAEHHAALDHLRPHRVLITVRNIFDVALSFFEKHRLQGNLDRFSDQWVVDYCVREARGLVDLRDELLRRSIPFEIVRYEDFTRYRDSRNRVTAFLGWKGGGATHAHLDGFGRSFEAERHGSTISSGNRQASEREMDGKLCKLAEMIVDQCSEYQRAFGYNADNYQVVNDASKFVVIQ